MVNEIALLNSTTKRMKQFSSNLGCFQIGVVEIASASKNFVPMWTIARAKFEKFIH